MKALPVLAGLGLILALTACIYVERDLPAPPPTVVQPVPPAQPSQPSTAPRAGGY